MSFARDARRPLRRFRRAWGCLVASRSFRAKERREAGRVARDDQRLGLVAVAHGYGDGRRRRAVSWVRMSPATAGDASERRARADVARDRARPRLPRLTGARTSVLCHSSHVSPARIDRRGARSQEPPRQLARGREAGARRGRRRVRAAAGHCHDRRRRARRRHAHPRVRHRARRAVDRQGRCGCGRRRGRRRGDPRVSHGRRRSCVSRPRGGLRGDGRRRRDDPRLGAVGARRA